MRRDILETAALYQNIIFPVFTNGTLLQEDYLKLFHKYRNLVPVLSLEGDQAQTDDRRGEGVYANLLSVMEKMMPGFRKRVLLLIRKEEPCPFSPYSDTNVKNCTLLDALQSPLFKKLNESNLLMKEHTGGCVLFEQEEIIHLSEL